MKILETFKNCRVTLHRESDGATFVGWINELSQSRCCIDLTDAGCSLKDRFSVEATGTRKLISFVGACIRVDRTPNVEPVSPEVGTVERRCTVELIWMGNGEFAEGKQAPRRKVKGLEFKIEIGESQWTATANDISALGIGFSINQDIAVGQEIGIQLPHEKGVIHAKAIVRHCRKVEEVWQAGAQIQEINRVDQALWRLFLESLG